MLNRSPAICFSAPDLAVVLGVELVELGDVPVAGEGAVPVLGAGAGVVPGAGAGAGVVPGAGAGAGAGTGAGAGAALTVMDPTIPDAQWFPTGQ
jgi:hypothetical protein